MKYWDEKHECMGREEMRALQSERLVETVKRVYEHQAPYRKKMDETGLKPEDIKSIDDLTKLPFTVKQDLRDNYPYGLFAVDMDDIVRIHASSGTTGKPTVVGYTKNDLDTWSEAIARLACAAGATEDDIARVADELSAAAKAANVEIIGGHTEVTDAVTRMITSAAVIAKAGERGILTTGGMKGTA